MCDGLIREDFVKWIVGFMVATGWCICSTGGVIWGILWVKVSMRDWA